MSVSGFGSRLEDLEDLEVLDLWPFRVDDILKIELQRSKDNLIRSFWSVILER
jgi:hypothetical protein